MKTMLTKKLFQLSTVAALIACAASNSFAQVKIGTNPTTIGANNNFEVEASTADRKISVDKTSGKITIADGTQGIDRVLTSDANGVASWVLGSKLSLTNGILPATWPNITTHKVPVKTGAQITLPAGKWLIFWRATYMNQTNATSQLWWDLTTKSSGYNGVTVIDPTMLGRGLSSMANQGWFATANIIYNVTASATTTYYIWVWAGGDAGFTSGNLTYSGEGNLFAIPVN